MNAALRSVPNTTPNIELVVAREPVLRECVARAVRRLLLDLNGECPRQMFRLVLDEVEAPMLSEVLSHCGGNQRKAADMLGINRQTLRKKLLHHGLANDPN